MKTPTEIRVGLFALLALGIVAFAILRVSDRGVIRGRGYRVFVLIDSAEGLTRKTPVEVAGIQVGYVSRLDLEEGRRARVVLEIDRRVKLGKDAVATVRTKGFLGETYIDLLPGHPEKGTIPERGEITATNPYVDLGKIAADAQSLIGRLNEITAKNEENVHRLIENLTTFSGDLKDLMATRKEDLSETMERFSSISRKVDEGRGTLGRLVNDEEIAENINEAARGVSTTVGGVNRFQFEIGYHLEYLGNSQDFKNYVGLNLKPRPDKYFILEFIADPNPSPERTTTTTTETTAGVTTTTLKEEQVVGHDDLAISAELAKSFYDFTFRGGLIESRGGVGLDWRRGPFKVEFSAFDFQPNNDNRPHLKAMGNLYLTKNLYLVSGVDDFISRRQDPDWFVGAGLSLLDEDIKSLFSAAALGAARAQ